MFIIELKYLVPITEVDKYLKAHREFLDDYYKKELFLASGPKKNREGGIIIALTTNKEYLESVLQQDPFYLAEIADYSLTEFTPVKHADKIKELILQNEGKLC